MKRVRTNNRGELRLSNKAFQTMQRIEALQRLMPADMSRSSMAARMGEQYKGVRKVYEALGYPEDSELDFNWFFNKWDRQDIASAVIDKPVEATWAGDLNITEIGTKEDKSALSKAWKELDKKFKVKKQLGRIDKLDGIGRYSLLLFGFNDVKEKKDFKKPAGKAVKLNYLKPVSEGNSKVSEWETDSSNERFGKPKYYEIEAGQPDENGGISFTNNLKVHHTRILHLASGSLVSDTYGRSRLKAIANRLEDLEKLMGGDAEMFWRGARPGYHASEKPEYTLGTTARENLEDELDKYEHDLRRFLTTNGIDIKALESQIEDPKNHVDIQYTGIAAQTGIPKRILMGSERGELSSSQDKDQWLTLVANRRTNYAEPEVFRSFIDKCMTHGILKETEYVVIWSDLFAPSDSEKAEVGKTRAESTKAYFEAPLAMEMIPIQLFLKYMVGLSKDQIEEFMSEMPTAAQIEDMRMAGAEGELKKVKELEEA